MNNQELFEEMKELILKTCKSYHDYTGYREKRSGDYHEGWNDAVEAITTDLLGRKEQDGAKLLEQAVRGMPSKNLEASEEELERYRENDEGLETLVPSLKLSKFPRICDCGGEHFHLKREDPARNPIGIKHFVECESCGESIEVTDYELW